LCRSFPRPQPYSVPGMSQARLPAAGVWLIPLRRSAASEGRPDQDGLLSASPGISEQSVPVSRTGGVPQRDFPFSLSQGVACQHHGTASCCGGSTAPIPARQPKPDHQAQHRRPLPLRLMFPGFSGVGLLDGQLVDETRPELEHLRVGATMWHPKRLVQIFGDLVVRWLPMSLQRHHSKSSMDGESRRC
jgi:hypothetical protein